MARKKKAQRKKRSTQRQIVTSDSVIDPEVKAFVFSLVSALGGFSSAEDNKYVLGDDAIAVLRDIKRWLRLYDDKLFRLDVARLLADANLVQNDLLEILALSQDGAAEGSFRAKIALLCVDLLTQLTWPLQLNELQDTRARLMQVPILQKAQTHYKSSLLRQPGPQHLRTIARICLPALARGPKERVQVDNNVIKVVLYLFRNIAGITSPEDDAIDEIENGIDRSTTIEQFQHQDVLNLILTICSNMDDDFQTHCIENIDIIYQLVKGVDVNELFMDKQEQISARAIELEELISKEKSMLASYARHAPSRHTRFGAMTWVQRDENKRATLFGQKSVSEQLSIAELDNSKKWRRPRQGRTVKAGEAASRIIPNVKLTNTARRYLRSFVEQFLDSSFNPLFTATRRTIERGVSDDHKTLVQQYQYLIAWFLKAESIRGRKRREPESNGTDEPGAIGTFALVAAVLNQETFVLLNRSMEWASGQKDWPELCSGMKCFTQILLTVQEMLTSPIDEDQEIAENILNRIFYEESTHDRVIRLLRSYKDQNSAYLDACTEQAHVFLKLLESYSKQNVDLQIRRKRRVRRATKAKVGSTSNAEDDQQVDAEAAEEIRQQSSERKFEFNKFAAKFVSQASVDTFIALLRLHKSLTSEQLKRIHRFFYRVAFKMDMTILFFRMDIISLLNKIIKGPDGLVLAEPTFKDWQELTKQIFRRLIKKLEERPALQIELLFSKMPSSLYYLEHGFHREIPKSIPKAIADLEVKPGMSGDEQIGVAVSVLVNQNKWDLLAWVKAALKDASEDRRSWETLERERQESLIGSESAPPSVDPPEIVVRGDDDQILQMHRDKHLRLLLTTLGLSKKAENLGIGQTTWSIPSYLSADDISRLAKQINDFEFSPPIYEDKSAEDLIRRKIAPREEPPQPVHGSDSEGESGSDLEPLFPAGGPNIHEAEHNGHENSKRKRSRRSKDELLDDKVLEEKRAIRRKLEADRRRKIKSELFVRESDDESDEERDRIFFEKERQLRERMNMQTYQAVQKAKHVPQIGDNRQENASSQRARIDGESDNSVTSVESDTESTDGSADSGRSESIKRRRLNNHIVDDDEDGMIEEQSDSALSDSSHVGSDKRPLGKAREARVGSTGPRYPADDTDVETDHESAPRALSSFAAVTPKPFNQVAATFSESGSDKENSNAATGAQSGTAPLGPGRRRNVRASLLFDSDSDE